MSNSLAIAAVTSTLRRLLEDGTKMLDDGSPDMEFTDLEVTTQPLDRARNNKNSNQINLFLYQTLPNAALRNMDMPRRVRSGEGSQPPLALNLNYLITAYGRNNEDTLSHRLLGRAMRILHDYSVLVASDLLSQVEIESLLSESGLDMQPERVRLTPVSMSMEEMSKLWMIFQTQYRISAAYQAAVLLIESTRPVRSRPPVLKRGMEDRGPDVMAGSLPLLEEVLPPYSQPSARLGEELIINGKNLDSQRLVVRFSSLRMQDPIEIEPMQGGSSNQIKVHLDDQATDPDALEKWIAGFYTLSLVTKRENLPGWSSNELAFSLAPKITVAPNSAPTGDLALIVICAPRIKKGQRIVLLFGESQIPVQTISTPGDISQPTTLRFFIPDVKSGTYVVRLRIDGSDSLPIILAGTPPRLEYDPDQMVTIT